MPLAALLALLAAAPGSAKEHPPLVDPATAKCTTCHDEMLKGTVKHPPAVEDCRNCHEFSQSEGRTQVALSAPPPALCVTCHDGLAKAAAGELTAPHAPVTDSCTNCHDPHSSGQPHLLKAAPGPLCLSCHPADDVNKLHPVPVGRADCPTCHAPHGSAVKGMLAGGVLHPPFAEKACGSCHRKGIGSRMFLRREGAALCYACHSDLEKTFAQGFVHTAVAKGMCTGCHSPHVASEPHLLRAKGNALCFPCHAAVQAKVSGAGAHPPAREDCTTCHDPHRSDVPYQLTAALPGLCLTCHDAADPGLVKKHLGADLAKVMCTSCHDPHGSPGKHLLAAGSVHPPFAEGSCDSCHEGSAAKLVENGGKKLCYACHSEIEDVVSKAKVQHGVFEVDRCTACHNPHAATRPNLLRRSGAKLCGDCHADQVAGKGEVQHGAIGLIGCQACHQPHGGEQPHLLRRTGNELCLGCHGPNAVNPAAGAATVKLLGRFDVPVAQAQAIVLLRLSADGQHDHPVTGHRVIGSPTKEELARAGTTFTGELSCLACHDPHKGPSRELPRTLASGGAQSCLTCHPK